MSYNSEIKKELSAISYHNLCCEKAALATFYAILSEEKRGVVTLKTQNINIARKIIILTNEILGFDVSFKIEGGEKRGKRLIIITVNDKNNVEILKNVLKLKSKKADIFSSVIAPEFTVNECCKKAAVQSAFIASGFVTSPKKAYHLEITTHKKHVTNDICGILFEMGFEPKVVTRQNKYVIYMKNNEEICDFLGAIGAKRSLFLFHEIKVEKEIKNEINRKMNCENANENKTINSAVLQTQAIQKLIKEEKFDNLSTILKETAQLRLNYPSAPLSQLVDNADFSITKSGLNHRLNKIIEISKNK